MNNHEKVLNTILSHSAPVENLGDGIGTYHVQVPGITFEITAKVGRWNDELSCAPFEILEVKYDFPISILQGGELEDETVYVIEKVGK